jgi:hypothetical protein
MPSPHIRSANNRRDLLQGISWRWGFLGLLVLFLLLTGCNSPTEKSENSPPSVSSQPTLPTLPVNVLEVLPLEPIAGCRGQFVPHTLEHITTVPGGDTVRQFEANGGGVAIGDLDNDGDLDVVLANHYEPNTVLWNEGHLTFQAERMPYGNTRAVNIVDVDGDGWLDIVLTRRLSVPDYWHNAGQAADHTPLAEGETRFAKRFEQKLLPGVPKYAYAMNWADLDGDGDLDLVTGSYNASLLIDLGNNFLLGGGGGVFYNENRGDRFMPKQLAPEAQALTIELLDLNMDGSLDILVGNDFAVQDQAWIRSGDGWLESTPFTTTTYSTMSFDHGDINNDGQWELLSTDMKPYEQEPEALAVWQPLMDDMANDFHLPGDPQVMENVLQVPTGSGIFRNEAARWGIEATGWSWSSKFGDLNNDGFLDLYVVNGMIEQEIFDYLPNHELVEQNQAFRNDGQGRFVPAPEWGLGSTLSGRGMSMADLDEDGDLDIVINNLRRPAQLFENQLCEGASLQVDLFWPDGANSRAIGATVVLHTNQGDYYRQVRAASGYLSGDPARIHFGFPVDATLQTLEIRWPDNLISRVNQLSADTRLSIAR